MDLRIVFSIIFLFILESLSIYYDVQLIKKGKGPLKIILYIIFIGFIGVMIIGF